MKTIGFMAAENANQTVGTRDDFDNMAKNTEQLMASIDRGMKWVVVGICIVGLALLFMCGMAAGRELAISDFNDAGIEHVTVSGPNGVEEPIYVRAGWEVTPVTEFGTNRIYRITKCK